MILYIIAISKFSLYDFYFKTEFQIMIFFSFFFKFADDAFDTDPHTHDEHYGSLSDLQFSAANDDVIHEDINNLFEQHKERYAPVHCRGYHPDRNAEIVEKVSTKQMKNVFVRGESYTHVIFGVALSLIEALVIGGATLLYVKYDAEKKIKEMELPRYVQGDANVDLMCVSVQ